MDVIGVPFYLPFVFLSDFLFVLLITPWLVIISNEIVNTQILSE